MEVADIVDSKVAIKELPKMRVATRRAISIKPEKDSSNSLKKILQANGFDYDKMDRYGVDIAIPVKKQYRHLRGYESWVRIPDSIDEIEGLKIKTIPNNQYAVLRVKVSGRDPLGTISSGWLELQDWVSMNGFRSSLNNPNKYMIEKLIEVEGVLFIELYFPL